MHLRGVLTLLLGSLLAGCAHVEPPRGGPEDRIPPGLAASTPPSDTTVAPFSGPVLLQFDERISQERIEDAVSVSPRTSPVEVRHGRSSIRVSLRNGWEAGQIYHVTVNRSLRDLFGNSLPGNETVVFSTGPEIPDSHLSGTVVDGLTGAIIREARVEAIRSPDSLVYAVQSDSAGSFALDRFPLGSYRVRAFQDANRNRSLELFEPSDSTDVIIEAGAPATVRLRLLATDSTAPAITSVAVDSLTLEVTFDDHLDPEQVIEPEQIVVVRPDGSAVAIDSARVASGPSAASQDEALPSPVLEVLFGPDEVLEPSAEYELRVTGIRNVNGLSGDAESTFEPPELPEAPEPAESPEPVGPPDPAAAAPAAPAATRSEAFGGRLSVG